MALYYDLPVYKDIYSLLLKIFEATRLFSREYKYTLGQDMKQVSLQLVKYIYRANKNKDKLPHLEALEDEFEILKLMVRLSVDIKLLKVKQQAEIAEIMERIGKQVSGWKKKSQ